jgi:hypothetical protein
MTSCISNNFYIILLQFGENCFKLAWSVQKLFTFEVSQRDSLSTVYYTILDLLNLKS